MGTLSDITAKASNTIKRQSTLSMGYQTLESPAAKEKENARKPKSPHFMTPTYASTKQSVPPSPQSAERSNTPVASKPVKAEGHGWAKTAANRVGFPNRTGDGTPRSKKEALMKQPKAISFPDKVCHHP